MTYSEYSALVGDRTESLGYIRDIVTYEMCYLTKAGMDVLGLKDPKEYCGRKCYKILHGANKPCPCCVNSRLAEGQEYYFEHYNEQLGRWYNVTARLLRIEGRACRLNIAEDITAQKGTSCIGGGFTTFAGKEGSSADLELEMFKKACGRIRSWREKGLSPNLSVDFSYTTLLKPDMLKLMQGICAEYKVPASALTIKVKESIRKMEHKQIERLIIKLEEAGFFVTVDDSTLYLRF